MITLLRNIELTTKVCAEEISKPNDAASEDNLRLCAVAGFKFEADVF
jgi:hypothetical protein